MEKMNRNITQQQLNQSRDKNIDVVMQSVSQTQKNSILSILKLSPIYVLAFVLLIALALTPTIDEIGDNTDPLDDALASELVLNESTTDTLVELSYISASLMSSGLIASNDLLMPLTAPTIKTSLETDIDEINGYFDMLKVFLNDDPFSDSIIVEDLEGGNYQNKISFTSNGNSFEFLINITDQDIEGILYIDDLMYFVEGKQVIEETESKLQLKAMYGNDYVKVEYKTDSEELETTLKYSVETSMNGVVTQKDIKVSIEDGSLKVTVEDLTSKYNLKKNTEEDQERFLLDYTIDGETGRATIYEDVDLEGNPVYRYEIREGNLTDTILVPIQPAPSQEQKSPYLEEQKQTYTT